MPSTYMKPSPVRELKLSGMVPPRPLLSRSLHNKSTEHAHKMWSGQVINDSGSITHGDGLRVAPGAP